MTTSLNARLMLHSFTAVLRKQMFWADTGRQQNVLRYSEGLILSDHLHKYRYSPSLFFPIISGSPFTSGMPKVTHSKVWTGWRYYRSKYKKMGICRNESQLMLSQSIPCLFHAQLSKLDLRSFRLMIQAFSSEWPSNAWENSGVSINQLLLSTGDQIIKIIGMYLRNACFHFVWAQMDMSFALHDRDLARLTVKLPSTTLPHQFQFRWATTLFFSACFSPGHALEWYTPRQAGMGDRKMHRQEPQ